MDKQDKEAGSAAGVGRSQMAAREKKWDECGIEEKVERLREVLRRVDNTLQHTTKAAIDASELARGHQHAEDGRVLTEARRINDMGAIGDFEFRNRHFDPLA